MGFGGFVGEKKAHGVKGSVRDNSLTNSSEPTREGNQGVSFQPEKT